MIKMIVEISKRPEFVGKILFLENYDMELLPKTQVSIAVETARVPELVELIKKQLYTGHIGDGKIFVTDLAQVVRVRTGDEGTEAL